MLEMRKRVQQKFGHVVLMIILGLLFAAPAQAHKLNIFAFAESGKVLVDSYFVDGTKARDSKVKVFDPSGKMLAEGMTDKQGHYEFSVPAQVELKITVDAGMGHRAEWIVPAADLGMVPTAVTDKQLPTGSRKVSVTASSASGSTAGEADIATAGAVDPAVLRQIVNKAVAESMIPMMRSIEELKQHDSLTQVIGSIGYIFGVFGLWVFFKSRRENPSPSKEKSANDR